MHQEAGRKARFFYGPEAAAGTFARRGGEAQAPSDVLRLRAVCVTGKGAIDPTRRVSCGSIRLLALLQRDSLIAT